MLGAGEALVDLLHGGGTSGAGRTEGGTGGEVDAGELRLLAEAAGLAGLELVDGLEEGASDVGLVAEDTVDGEAAGDDVEELLRAEAGGVDRYEGPGGAPGFVRAGRAVFVRVVVVVIIIAIGLGDELTFDLLDLAAEEGGLVDAAALEAAKAEGDIVGELALILADGGPALGDLSLELLPLLDGLEAGDGDRVGGEDAFENPTVPMLVDRTELETQLFGNLAACGIGNVRVATSKRDLREILTSDYRGLISTRPTAVPAAIWATTSWALCRMPPISASLARRS